MRRAVNQWCLGRGRPRRGLLCKKLWPVGATEAPGQILRMAGMPRSWHWANRSTICIAPPATGPNWRDTRLAGAGRTRDRSQICPRPPHDATGHTPGTNPDALLIDITTRGTAAIVGRGYESEMMGFGEVLSEAEIIGRAELHQNPHGPQRSSPSMTTSNAAGRRWNRLADKAAGGGTMTEPKRPPPPPVGTRSHTARDPAR